MTNKTKLLKTSSYSKLSQVQQGSVNWSCTPYLKTRPESWSSFYQLKMEERWVKFSATVPIQCCFLAVTILVDVQNIINEITWMFKSCTPVLRRGKLSPSYPVPRGANPSASRSYCWFLKSALQYFAGLINFIHCNIHWSFTLTYWNTIFALPHLYHQTSSVALTALTALTHIQTTEWIFCNFKTTLAAPIKSSEGPLRKFNLIEILNQLLYDTEKCTEVHPC